MIKINQEYIHKDGGIYTTRTTRGFVNINSKELVIVEYSPVNDLEKIYVRTVEHFLDNFKLK